MAAQLIDHQPGPSFIERIAALARRLSVWMDHTAFRSQLGPTRDLERRDFIPARRR